MPDAETLVSMGAPPMPPEQDDRQRWAWQERRYDLIAGGMQRHADDRLNSFFHEDVRQFLPDAETSCNPFASFMTQVSTLYDDTPISRIDGATPDAIRLLGLPRYWAQQQETLLYAQSMLEAVVRLDWNRRRGQVGYRTVPAHRVWAERDEQDPTQAAAIHELRWRRVGGRKAWCWEHWDPRGNNGNGEFRIEAVVDGVVVDVTAALYDGLNSEGKADPYPFRDRDGKPILPYEVFHSRVPMDLWQPPRGEELVAGSLTAAALWTFWLGGFRDLTHPRRAVIDGEIDYPRVAPAAGTSAQQSYMAVSAHYILPVRSIYEGRTARLDQWDSAFDPSTSGQAIAHFIAQMALYAGISPADVSIGSAGLSRTSGFAIEVSRQGQRAARRRVLLPMTLGDQGALVRAARMVNGIMRAEVLPEREDAYVVTYADVGRTSEEQKADLDLVQQRRTMGAISQADVIRAVHPTMDDDQITTKLIEIASVDALARQAATLAERVPEPDAPEPGDEPEPVDGPPAADGAEKAADTALNGAQVTAALAIVQQVAARQLPRASAVTMLQAFFSLEASEAEQILGEVGRTFFAPEDDALGPPPESTEDESAPAQQ